MPPHCLLQDSDRIRAYVDPAAIAHNLAQMRERMGPSPARVWATAKADAYGHGLTHVMAGLRQADGISVETLSEARQLRHIGWRGPILIHAGLLSRPEAKALDLPHLHLIISQADQLDWLSHTRPSEPPTVWLRYAGDTRMGGFDDIWYRRAYAHALALQMRKHIRGIGHLNHYAGAENADGTQEADICFRRAIAGLDGPISCANSAAMLRHPLQAARTNWVRPGITLYGVSPLHGLTGPDLGLRPAMTVQARLADVQPLAAGTSLGYCGAFIAPHAMTVGLVTCGYADGYPRHAQTGTPVAVGGRITRLLGRPSMNMLAIDLSDMKNTPPGSPVTLWGHGLPVETVAGYASTIAAELLTALTARVPFTALAHVPQTS